MVGAPEAAAVGPASWPGASARRTALVGRHGELEVLRRALVNVQAGLPGVALVRGGSGVGKTALVQAFVAEAGAGALVLCGRCYEREQVPHNAFDGLLDGLTRHLLGLLRAEIELAELLALVRLFPALRRLPEVAEARVRAEPGDGPRWREHGYAAFKRLIAWLGRPGPVASLELLAVAAWPVSRRSAPPAPPPMTLSAFGMNLHAATTADGRGLSTTSCAGPRKDPG